MVTKELIKELRVKIDGLSQLVKSINTQYRVDINLKHREESLENFTTRVKETGFGTKHLISNELKESYKSLILAKAWLGKILGELGEENPYKSGYKTVEDIEPTADVAKKLFPAVPNEAFDVNALNHIEKVDWLRQEIDSVLKSHIDLTPEEVRNDNKHPNIHYYKLYYKKCLEEARFWLEFELQRIKENGL